MIKIMTKALLACIVDACIVGLFITAFIVLHDNALGMVHFDSQIIGSGNGIYTSSCNYLDFLAIVIGIPLIYLTVAALNRWNTLGRLLVFTKGSQPKRASRFLLSLSALAIDSSIVFSAAMLAAFFLRRYIYVDLFVAVLCVQLAYCLVAGFCKGQTMGKHFLGIHLVPAKGANDKTVYLLRELLYKYGLGVLLPYILLRILGISTPYAIFLNITIWGSFALLLYYCIKGESWWSYLSKTSKNITPAGKLRIALAYGFILGIWFTSYAFVKYENNRIQPDQKKVCGFNFPQKHPEYPTNKIVGPYAEFLAKQKQSPKEYILGLFKKYDIVIISETFHDESTQWKLFTDIVSDKNFISNVGTVFTEYGCVDNQKKLNGYLKTRYANDTLLEKATAKLMFYLNGGYFCFTKNLNLLNRNLSDSLKVKLFYTDMFSKGYIDHVKGFDQALIPNLDNRDSLMAQVIIGWYRKQEQEGNRKKCLVITNHLHALGYPRGINHTKAEATLRHKREGQYIFETFPYKTATVVQNAPTNASVSLYMCFFQPKNRGIWDKAFALSGNRPVGFDLKNTPFGTDSFDMIGRANGTQSKRSYQDYFTGVIFNKPYSEMQQRDIPFKRYAVECEYRDGGNRYSQLDYQNALRAFGSNDTRPETTFIGPSVINMVSILSLVVIIVLTFFTATYHFIRQLLKRTRS